MNRCPYPDGLKEWLINNAKYYTSKELISVIKEKFDYDYTLKSLQRFLCRNKIEYKYIMPQRVHKNTGVPIGSERVKQGMVQIKVAPKKWEYKQRYIYEKYHNVKLKKNEYVVFLDQNRNNFDINNLKLLSPKESGFMINQDLFSKDREVTKTGILATKLHYKVKEVGEKNE